MHRYFTLFTVTRGAFTITQNGIYEIDEQVTGLTSLNKLIREAAHGKYDLREVVIHNFIYLGEFPRDGSEYMA